MEPKVEEAAPRPFHELIKQQRAFAPEEPTPEVTDQPAQSIVALILAGALGSAVAAGLWAAITVISGIQIGWMAVGVGFLVGMAVRLFSAGSHPMAGYVAAFFSFLSCLLGNLLAVCGIVAQEQGVAWTEVLGTLDLQSANILMVLSFSPIDLLFYGLALYFGFKLASGD